MALNERLAERVEDLILARPDVTVRRMFGGKAWMLAGNMAVGVLSTGDLLVRLAPDDVAEALRQPDVHEFGRPGSKPMTGFVIVDADAVEDDALADWVDRGAARAAELPPK